MPAEEAELLALEDNEEVALEDNNDMALATGDDDDLLSPPRDWPDCFSTSAELKAFIGTELGGRRVRLSEAPDAEHLAMAEGLLSGSDALQNALTLRSRFGWEVLGGYMLFERASTPGAFVSRPHHWSANARGLWIDLTPRRHKDIVLVESASTAIPPLSAAEAPRIEALRAAELAAAEKRDAERKAAKKAAKAAEKEAKEREKLARRAAREAEAEAKAAHQAESALAQLSYMCTHKHMGVYV